TPRHVEKPCAGPETVENTRRARKGQALSRFRFVEKGRRCRPFPPGHVFPAPGGAAGETRRETLLRKASEPAAHVAGFGLHLEGFGPPSLPNGVFDGLRA